MSDLIGVKQTMLAVFGLILITSAVIGVGLLGERLGCDGYKACKYAIELALDDKTLTIKESLPWKN